MKEKTKSWLVRKRQIWHKN